jgi:hypothetical protein
MKVRSLRTLAAVGVGGGLLCLIPAAVAAAAPVGSSVVTVTRQAADPTKIDVSWAPVDGAGRYNVSVYDGTTENVTSTKTTSMALTRAEPCVKLRVNIASRDTFGAGGTSKNIWLNSLAPGGAGNLQATRNADTGEVTASWSPPSWGGVGDFGNYHVQLVRDGDKIVMFDGTTRDLATSIPKVDATNSYTLQVTTTNGYGACTTAKIKVGTNKPGAPSKLKVVRDPATPSKVNVSWAAPTYAGAGSTMKYVLGYGVDKVTSWSPVEGTSATLNLDSVSNWVVSVKGVNQFGEGPAAAVKANPVAAVGASTSKPGVTITQSGLKVSVALTSKIGVYTQYPKVVVRVRPTIAPDGFVDEHWGQNGAQTINFNTLPLGLYTITVSGANDSEEVEWARQAFNIGDVGVVKSTELQLAYAATSSGGDVAYITKKSNTTADSALRANVALRLGKGYGVWTRASVSNGRISGYLLEYNPAYGTPAAPAMTMTTYVNGTKCGNPVAVAKVPAALGSAGTHKVMVVAKGDTLYATVDDVTVVNVAALSTAVSKAGCKSAALTGKQAGVRIFNKDGLAAFTALSMN